MPSRPRWFVTDRQLQGVGPVIGARIILERQKAITSMRGWISVDWQRLLNSANPASSRNRRPSGRDHCGEERTDRRTENRPSLPRGPPLHHHYCFDDRKGGAVSFRRPPRRRAQKPFRAYATPCGRWKLLNPSLPLTVFTTPSSCPLATNLKLRSSPTCSCPADSACLEIGRPVSSTCSQSSKPSISTGGEKAPATDRFQYATSKDACFCSARRADERGSFMEDELR
jgi:hypothetical protein